jgi:hypothetical protein
VVAGLAGVGFVLGEDAVSGVELAGVDSVASSVDFEDFSPVAFEVAVALRSFFAQPEPR